MPHNLTITINNSTSVTVTWNIPEMANGIIRNYTIIVLNDNTNETVFNETVSNLTFRYVVVQLTHNTDYVVDVSAVTIRSGDATSTDFTTPPCKHVYHSIYKLYHNCFKPVPTIPLNVTLATGDMLRTLIVQWEPPSNPEGIITTYMVIYNNMMVDTSSNDTNFTITGLDPYTNYSITVIACTSNGCGNESDVVIGTTEEEGEL